jgi:DNA-directed RNA polymerase specialized sigma24 family protein
VDTELQEIDEILCRVAGGDREALQKFIARYESRIRRRIRGKLASWNRRIFDTDDVFVSTCRRLDEALLAGRVVSDSAGALEQYICGTAVRIVQEAARRELRIRVLLEELRGSIPAVQPGPSDGHDLDELLAELDEDDRDLLMQWARSESHATAAAVLGIPMSAYRKRWSRLRARLVAAQCAMR